MGFGRNSASDRSLIATPAEMMRSKDAVLALKNYYH
jgi:hypothetical protein